MSPNIQIVTINCRRVRSLVEKNLTKRSTNLFFDVFKRWRRDDAEAYKKDISLRIGEWAESVVIFLSGRIKQAQCVRLTSYHYCHCIVVKHLQCSVNKNVRICLIIGWESQDKMSALCRRTNKIEIIYWWNVCPRQRVSKSLF